MESLLVASVLFATVSGQGAVHALISGDNQNVTIKPYPEGGSTQRTLGLSTNFMFSCSSSTPIAPFELQILGPGNETKMGKVSQNQTTSGTIYTYNITNYTDDQTTFRCLMNSSVSPNLILTVFYGPSYTTVSHPYGKNGTNASVTVKLIANPHVTAHFNWSLNGSNISSNSRISLMPNEIHFNPLYVSDFGTYMVIGCNNISCGNQTFELDVYFPPIFSNSHTNFTELVEIATGRNRNFTCSVVREKGPDPLNITLSIDPPLNDVADTSNATSITVTITHASLSNTALYQCQACYGDDVSYCSTYSFDTYVGGPPDNVTVKNISIARTSQSGQKTKVSINIYVTDHSTVPMTGVNFVINQTAFNFTIDINAPLKGMTHNLSDDFLLDDGGELATMSNVAVDIFALNMVGSSFVKSVVLADDFDATSWLFLILVIACPVGGCILLVVCVSCCCLCYRKRKKQRGFRLVSMEDD